MYKRYFIGFSIVKHNSQPTNKIISNQLKIEHQDGNSLSKITDKELLKTIRPLLNKNQVLQAVEITSKYYGNKFKSMSFKDWYKLVNELHKKITS